MAKKAIALLLALVMALSLCPVTVLAEPVEDDLTVSEASVEEIVNEEPIEEAPAAEEPAEETSIDEEPAAEEPVKEVPAEEAPVDEEPAAEEQEEPFLKKAFNFVGKLLNSQEKAEATPVTGLQGKGTKAEPYLIGTLAELEYMAQQVNTPGGKTKINETDDAVAYYAYYVLTADIGSKDGDKLTTAIGKFSTSVINQFEGKFDGAGHTVWLNINEPTENYQGMFGYASGTAKIQNLITEGTVTGASGVGGICGNGAHIVNCINRVTVTGKEWVGGITGVLQGDIDNCINEGVVSGCDDSYNVGGVCGKNGGTITNCYNHGTVTGTTNVGGVCGWSMNPTFSKIYNCYNSNDVTGTTNVGGVCGSNQGTIANCYNSGSITGNKTVGGVCGENVGTITNCYNSSTVTGTTIVGGACGNNSEIINYGTQHTGTGGSMKYCYSVGTMDPIGENWKAETVTAVEKVTDELAKAASQTTGALIDLLNGYTESDSYPSGWLKWYNEEGQYPTLPCHVSVVTTGTGTVTVGNTTPPAYNVADYFAKGDKVTLTVAAGAGCELKAGGPQVNSGNGPVALTDNQDGTYTFEMPDCPVTVAVEFEVPHHTHKIGGEDVDFQPWTSNNSLPTESGNYYLTQDVTLTSDWNISDGKDVELCLNGHIIHVSGDYTAIFVAAGGSLTIDDCGTNDHPGHLDADGLWHLDTETYVVNTVDGEKNYPITGGILTKDKTYVSFVYVRGNFTLNGGTFAGNSFNLNDGAVVRFLDTDGVFTMNGGCICGNINKGDGPSVIYYNAKDATFIMNGGKICDNKSKNAGAVYLYDNSTFIMNGGEICHNSSKAGAALYYHDDSTPVTVKLLGGKICDNETTGTSSGAVDVWQNVTLGGDIQIYGNHNSSGIDRDLNSSYCKAVISTETPPKPGMLVGTPKSNGQFTVSDSYIDGQEQYFFATAENAYIKVNSNSYLSVASISSGKKITVAQSNGGVVYAPQYAAKDTEVTLTVVPDDGYELKSLTVTDANGGNVTVSENKFTMPDATVTVTAEFVKAVEPITGITTWSALQDAINAATEPTTIKLTEDLTAPEQGGTSITIPAGKEITIDLNGFKLDRGLSEKSAAAGGHVITVNGKLTVKDSSKPSTGKITGGNNSEFIGGVRVNAGGELTLNGGSICDNKTNSSTGGVFVYSGAKFTMTGGSITGNTTGNTNSGGGVTNQGTFIMTGGTITGNKAKEAGGVKNTGSMTVGGTAKIIDNKNYTDGFAPNLETKGELTLKNLAEGAEIGILAVDPSSGKLASTARRVAFASGTEEDLNYFTSDREGVAVYYENDKLMQGDAASYFALQELLDSAENEGTVTLRQNFNATEDDFKKLEELNKVASLTLRGDDKGAGKTVTLDLNGYTLNANELGRVLMVTDGSTLIVKDSSKSSAGKITGGLATGTDTEFEKINGGAVYVAPGCKLELQSGTISGNEAKDSGGAVYVQESATFTMTGGTISDNKAPNGGGGAVYVRGTFIMNGTISGNSAKSGAGVYVYYANDKTPGTFVMNGGTISGNIASDKGGGVYADNLSAVSILGGEISGNSAVKLGGGMCCNTAITVGGSAKITGNTVSNAADNVYLRTTAKKQYLPVVKISTETSLTGNTTIGVSTDEELATGTSLKLVENVTKDSAKTFAIDGNPADLSLVWHEGELYLVKNAEAPASGDGFSIDYALEKIFVNEGYEVSTSKDFTKLIASGTDIVPGTTYYVRKAAAGVIPASRFTNFVAPARPDAPNKPVLNSSDETSVTVTAVIGQEYSIDGGTTWVSDGGNGDGDNTTGTITFTGLQENTSYRIITRKAAVTTSGSEAFASENSAALSITIKSSTKDNPFERIIKQFFDWLFGKTEPEQPSLPDVSHVVKAAATVTATVVITKIVVDRLHAIKTAYDAAAATEETPKINAEEMPMVAIGSSGDAIKTLQTELNAQGYDCGEADGVFGQDTLNAVIAFQTANGLDADGVVGAQTWTVLL